MTAATEKGGGEQPRGGARGMGRGSFTTGQGELCPPAPPLLPVLLQRWPRSTVRAGAPHAPGKGKWSGDGVGVSAAEVPSSLPRRSRLASLVAGESAPRCRRSRLGEALPLPPPPPPQPIAASPLPFRSSPRSPCRLQNGANSSPAAPMEPPRGASAASAGQQRPLPARAGSTRGPARPGLREGPGRLPLRSALRATGASASPKRRITKGLL